MGDSNFLGASIVNWKFDIKWLFVVMAIAGAYLAGKSNRQQELDERDARITKLERDFIQTNYELLDVPLMSSSEVQALESQIAEAIQEDPSRKAVVQIGQKKVVGYRLHSPRQQDSRLTESIQEDLSPEAVFPIGQEKVIIGYRPHTFRPGEFHVPSFLTKVIDPNYQAGQWLFRTAMTKKHYPNVNLLVNPTSNPHPHFTEMCVLSEDRCMMVFEDFKGQIVIVVRKIDRIKLFLAVIDHAKDIDASYFE